MSTGDKLLWITSVGPTVSNANTAPGHCVFEGCERRKLSVNGLQLVLFKDRSLRGQRAAFVLLLLFVSV